MLWNTENFFTPFEADWLVKTKNKTHYTNVSHPPAYGKW